MTNVNRNTIYFLGFILSTIFISSNTYASSYPDFTKIVEENMPAVVIVNATRSSNISQNNEFQNPPGMPEEFNDLFKKFFDERQNTPKRGQPSSGSGFILSSDGYIMTNHHVVSGSDNISILTNDRTTYEAELIGSDKRSDLALLKIKARNLPVVKIASMDNVKLGEWLQKNQ